MVLLVNVVVIVIGVPRDNDSYCTKQYTIKPRVGHRRKRSDPVGGDKGIRTLDPLLAKQVLSQLSYIPMMAGCTRQRAPHENDSCTVIQYTQSSPFSILIRHFVRRSCCLLFIPTSKEAVDKGNAFFRRTGVRRTASPRAPDAAGWSWHPSA